MLVTCDPTNLKTTKVAKGDCVASEGGYRCDYVVTVTNMGEDPHNGQIVVDEQFGFAPSSVKFSPEWRCPQDGGGFHCTHPPVHLEKGESVELKVSATVPDGPHCKLRNTAHMTVPEANTRFNGEPGDDTASATANIPSKSCVTPDRPQCEPKTNELRSESGACVCKSGTVRNKKGHLRRPHRAAGHRAAGHRAQALPGRQAGAEERALPVDAASAPVRTERRAQHQRPVRVPQGLRARPEWPLRRRGNPCRRGEP